MAKGKKKQAPKFDVPYGNSKPEDQKAKAFSNRFYREDLALIERIGKKIGSDSMIKVLRYALRVTDEVIK